MFSAVFAAFGVQGSGRADPHVVRSVRPNIAATAHPPQFLGVLGELCGSFRPITIRAARAKQKTPRRPRFRGQRGVWREESAGSGGGYTSLTTRPAVGSCNLQISRSIFLCFGSPRITAPGFERRLPPCSAASTIAAGERFPTCHRNPSPAHVGSAYGSDRQTSRSSPLARRARFGNCLFNSTPNLYTDDISKEVAGHESCLFRRRLND